MAGLPPAAAVEIEEPATLRSQRAALLPGGREEQLERTTCLLGALISAALGAVLTSLLLGSRTQPPTVCLSHSCVTAAAELLHSMDVEVPPCDDFYTHTCGKWSTLHPMPASRASYSTFSVLAEQNDAQLRTLLERVEAPMQPIRVSMSPVTKARAYYAACMDEKAIEPLGARPLLPMLSDLSWTPITDSWSNSDWEELSRRLGRLQRQGTMPLFYWWVMADEGNATANVVHVGQSGLGLPSREYYLHKTADDPYLRAYTTFCERLLELAATDGALPAGSQSAVAALDPLRRSSLVQEVLAFETALAHAYVPMAVLRDPAEYYQPVASLDELQLLTDDGAQAGLFRWMAFVNAYYGGDHAGVEGIGRGDVRVALPSPLVVSGSSYFERVFSSVVASTKISTVVAYLQLQVLQDYAHHLSRRYIEAGFEFKKALSDTPEMPERWKLCVGRTDNNVGYATGRLFVDEFFSSASRDAALRMIHGIKMEFRSKLPTLDWLDEAGARFAAHKVQHVYDMIGYPDWITDDQRLASYYAELEPGPNASYFEWLRRATAFEVNENIRDLSRPVDRKRWGMTAPTVNAYYSPAKNLIAFPAGILQPPFWYGETALSALNFGGVGSVIGHELTHGFDDQGAKYDAEGNLAPWWSADVELKFLERTKCLGAQYSQLTNDEGEHIDGNLTMGENIADNGGIRLSHAAWLASGGGAGNDALSLPGLPGYSADQLFFLAYAQVWCGSVRPSEAHKHILSDPHSPHRARVNAVLQNTPAFAEAFSCPVGSTMNPTDRCAVWA